MGQPNSNIFKKSRNDKNYPPLGDACHNEAFDHIRSKKIISEGSFNTFSTALTLEIFLTNQQ